MPLAPDWFKVGFWEDLLLFSVELCLTLSSPPASYIQESMQPRLLLATFSNHEGTLSLEEIKDVNGRAENPKEPRSLNNTESLCQAT